MAACDFVMPFGTFTGYALKQLPGWYLQRLESSTAAIAPRFPDASTALGAFFALPDTVDPPDEGYDSPRTPSAPAPTRLHGRLASRLNAVHHDPTELDKMLDAGIGHLDDNIRRVYHKVHDGTDSLHKRMDAREAQTAHMMELVWHKLAVGGGDMQVWFGHVHGHISSARADLTRHMDGMGEKLEKVVNETHVDMAAKVDGIQGTLTGVDARLEQVDFAALAYNAESIASMRQSVDAIAGFRDNFASIASLRDNIETVASLQHNIKALTDALRVSNRPPASPVSSLGSVVRLTTAMPRVPSTHLDEWPSRPASPAFPSRAESKADYQQQRTDDRNDILLAQLHRTSCQRDAVSAKNDEFTDISAKWMENETPGPDVWRKLKQLVQGRDIAIDEDMD